MFKTRVTATTEITKKSNQEISDFINDVKESFDNVVIISIENLPMNYEKYNKYTYRVKFYNDTYLKE